jgi:glyoxylase I family protein
MAEIVSFLHASLMVSDLERARAFYEGVLGLKPSPARPEMSFTGIWYDIGAAQIHLICLPNNLTEPDSSSQRPAHGGRDRHTALGVRAWEELRASLDAAGLPYTLSQSGRQALFVRDPDGNALELVALG